jgi:hypothetical protein
MRKIIGSSGVVTADLSGANPNIYCRGVSVSRALAAEGEISAAIR